ncbi:nad(P)-binding protein [Pyrenophora seminiperda CCB06]|uniref:Nad(P)-binding protein n=1 Tax=Pyrenophora seminiperda CCB06 TaxID=1302712 RepID=A0A3M7MAZ3_9PLEO|nr:nad(P)-binding protein [Pyrenophora seminiperda CCB06]
MASSKLTLNSSVTTKRQKLLLPSSDSYTEKYMTPPVTPDPAVSVVHTTSLRVIIPQRQIPPEEQRRIKLRVGAAERWVPKLQKPFPTNKEIKDAYPYKLMRHYTDGRILAPVIRPPIDRSPRVDDLRRRFPLVQPPSSAPPSSTILRGTKRKRDQGADGDENSKYKVLLRQNKEITRSPFAQKLAWKAFSTLERASRGREAMMLSGLFADDLEREALGLANNLPEWKKVNTGRYANEGKIPELD